MDDLHTRIKALLYGDEINHMKDEWIRRLAKAGVDISDARQWTTEIEHVIDAHEMILRHLLALLQQEDLERIVLDTQGFAAVTHDILVYKIIDATETILDQVEQYLPPEPDDEDEE